MDGGAKDGGVAVVVGPLGSTVTISGGVSYLPDGTVRHHQLAAADASGVGVAALEPSGITPGVTTRVTHDGEVIYSGSVHGGWYGSEEGSASQQPTDATLADAVREARGPALDPAILTAFISAALRDTRLSVQDVTVRLRWSGTVNGEPAALLTVQPPRAAVCSRTPSTASPPRTGWTCGCCCPRTALPSGRSPGDCGRKARTTGPIG